MLAGETSTILLSAKVSTTFSETLDEAAPMTTDGLDATRAPAEAVETDMSVESPESWTSWQRHGATHATRGVDVGHGQADARDLRGTEEGQVAGQRQDAAHPEGVRAGLAACTCRS